MIDLSGVPDGARIVRIFEIVSHYIKTHERFLIIVLAAFLCWGLTGKFQDLWLTHEKRVYDIAQATRQADTEKNVALATANAANAQQFKQLAEKTLAQNAALQQRNANLQTQLTKQQAADAGLNSTDLATRIQILADAPTNSIAPGPGDSFSVSKNAAILVAQALEKIPALTEQLANTAAERDGLQAELTQQSKLVIGLNTQIGGLQTEIKDADKACTARVNVEKAKAAKAKRKWFVTGSVVGIIVRAAVKHFAGI